MKVVRRFLLRMAEEGSRGCMEEGGGEVGGDAIHAMDSMVGAWSMRVLTGSDHTPQWNTLFATSPWCPGTVHHPARPISWRAHNFKGALQDPCGPKAPLLAALLLAPSSTLEGEASQQT